MSKEEALKRLEELQSSVPDPRAGKQLTIERWYLKAMRLFQSLGVSDSLIKNFKEMCMGVYFHPELKSVRLREDPPPTDEEILKDRVRHRDAGLRDFFVLVHDYIEDECAEPNKKKQRGIPKKAHKARAVREELLRLVEGKKKDEKKVDWFEVCEPVEGHTENLGKEESMRARKRIKNSIDALNRYREKEGREPEFEWDRGTIKCL